MLNIWFAFLYWWTHTFQECKNNRVARLTTCFSCSWAEARITVARMTLTIKLDGNWSSFQLANNTPPLSVTGSVIAPSARMPENQAAWAQSLKLKYSVAFLRFKQHFRIASCNIKDIPRLHSRHSFCFYITQRVSCNWQCARSVQHARTPEQAYEATSPKTNKCDKQISSWRYISCHTDKNRYYTWS